MTHRCPARGCPRADIPDDRLMCGPHWYMVPPLARRDVYAAYDHGRGMLGELPGPELAEAQHAAITAVNDRLARQ